MHYTQRWHKDAAEFKVKIWQLRRRESKKLFPTGWRIFLTS